MEVLIEIIARYRKLILFAIIAFFVVVIALVAYFIIDSLSPTNILKGQIKDVVSKSIDNRDLVVDKIVAQSGSWYLGRINGTTQENKDNTAYVVLQKINNKLVLKFGPGTYFEKSALDDAGVPSAISTYLVDDKYVVDPIVNYLPYKTDKCLVKFTAPPGGEDGSIASTLSIVPHMGVHATDKEKSDCIADTKLWIQSLGLKADDYTVIIAE